MPEPVWLSPLGGAARAHGLSAEIAESPDAGMITLKGAPDALAAALTAAGAPTPGVRRAEGDERRRAIWMAPDEMLLRLPRADVPAALAAAERAMAGRDGLALDVTDARAVFTIDGPGARETLAKGAPVDLHPSAFGVGDARRTHLGQIACGFWMTGARRFELVCFRSVAGYVFEWLVESADADADVGLFETA